MAIAELAEIPPPVPNYPPPADDDTDVFIAGITPLPKQEGSLPAARGGSERISIFYNSHDGTCLGRTPKSWLQIIVFYAFFYGLLAAFFSLMLMIFLQSVHKDRPKWVMDESGIGSVPGTV